MQSKEYLLHNPDHDVALAGRHEAQHAHRGQRDLELVRVLGAPAHLINPIQRKPIESKREQLIKSRSRNGWFEPSYHANELAQRERVLQLNDRVRAQLVQTNSKPAISRRSTKHVSSHNGLAISAGKLTVAAA
jgi:hypothetical protein